MSILAVICSKSFKLTTIYCPIAHQINSLTTTEYKGTDVTNYGPIFRQEHKNYKNTTLLINSPRFSLRYSGKAFRNVIKHALATRV